MIYPRGRGRRERLLALIESPETRSLLNGGATGTGGSGTGGGGTSTVPEVTIKVNNSSSSTIDEIAGGSAQSTITRTISQGALTVVLAPNVTAVAGVDYVQNSTLSGINRNDSITFPDGVSTVMRAEGGAQPFSSRFWVDRFFQISYASRQRPPWPVSTPFLPWRLAMRGRVFVIWFGLIALGMLGPLADVAQASGMPPQYQLVDLGPAGTGSGESYPQISNDGVLSAKWGAVRTAGQYSEGRIWDQQTPYVIDANYLRKAGSDTNLLPAKVADPSTGIMAISPNGEAVGFLRDGAGFYFNSQTGEMISPKSLPDLGTPTQPLGINALHQMVGVQDGSHAVYFSDPTALPVELKALVVNLGDWQLWSATSINDLGQIVGVGWAGDTVGYHYFRLDPIPVPEPATWVAFALISAIGVHRFCIPDRGRAPSSRPTR